VRQRAPAEALSAENARDEARIRAQAAARILQTWPDSLDAIEGALSLVAKARRFLYDARRPES
jgi:hypothetical protein